MGKEVASYIDFTDICYSPVCSKLRIFRLELAKGGIYKLITLFHLAQ
jgi:hypothetical protein